MSSDELSMDLPNPLHAARQEAKAFIECVKASQLIPTELLEPFLATYRSTQAPDAQTGELARALVSAKLLTRWQAERLQRGKSGGFFIDCYKLMTFLGRGATGVVYMAEHVRMNRRVALKILPREFVDNNIALTRFHRESQALAALDHPNVVRAYDLNRMGQSYYLVMEYVDGRNLEQAVVKNGPMPIETAVDYIRQAADGLAHAHERGLIHRDIKPGNLLITNQGVVKLLDLGLVHWVNGAETITSDSSELLGTPHFMAPEQAIDVRTVDARADLYSLGCTLYYLLTGQKAFVGNSLAQTLMRHQLEEAPDPRKLRPEIPESLSLLVRKLMEKSPSDRFPTARATSEALRQWLERSRSTQDSDLELAAQTPTKYLIMVADDDPLIRKLLSRVLISGGYDVLPAEDGADAIRKLSPEVSVVCVDVEMPYASGLDVLNNVRERFPETPVIMISAGNDVRIAVAAMREGAFDYVTKPCDVNVLLERVREAIVARRRTADQKRAFSNVVSEWQKSHQ